MTCFQMVLRTLKTKFTSLASQDWRYFLWKKSHRKRKYPLCVCACVCIQIKKLNRDAIVTVRASWSEIHEENIIVTGSFIEFYVLKRSLRRKGKYSICKCHKVRYISAPLTVESLSPLECRNLWKSLQSFRDRNFQGIIRKWTAVYS